MALTPIRTRRKYLASVYPRSLKFSSDGFEKQLDPFEHVVKLLWVVHTRQSTLCSAPSGS
jgi:hypothetical protein